MEKKRKRFILSESENLCLLKPLILSEDDDDARETPTAFFFECLWHFLFCSCWLKLAG